MKSIRAKLLGVLLGLLLAGGNWSQVHAPREEPAPFPTSTPALIQVNGVDTVIPENTPFPVSDNQPVKSMTATPEGLAKPLATGTASVAPATRTASCSEGPVGTGVFVWPADNHSLTGNDYGPGHPGIDIAAGEGSPVYAADAGVVIAMGNDEGGYGNVIEIDHHNGYFTVYAHLSVIGVSVCQSVEAGQWIGAAGSTGDANGAHLHFGVEQDGQAIDPWTVLP